MEGIIEGLQLAVAALALASLLALPFRRDKRVLHLVWGLFCGSLAVMMVRELGDEALGAYGHLVGIGACATCNGYWLVARALFRGERAFTAWHLALAATVAALVVIRELLRFAAAQGVLGGAAAAGSIGGLGELLALLGSGVLVLTVREGIVGWDAADRRERRLRGLFLAAFASCVGLCMVVPGALAALGVEGDAERLLQAAAALLVLLVTNVLVLLRGRQSRAGTGAEGAATARGDASRSEPDPRSEPALAGAIEAEVRGARRYLEAELRVAHVAAALAVPEYRVSRAVTGALGERNFNRYVNRHRVEHARRLLEDPSKDHWPVLVIALESGFASIGPFNRAFKAFTGTTPGAYRAASRRPAAQAEAASA